MTRIHFAGSDIRINDRLRQRCAYCGDVLIDYDLAATAVPVDQPGPPGTWPVGALVAIDGSMSYVVEHVPGAEPLPDGTCYATSDT